jgi:hypothetical protein
MSDTEANVIYVENESVVVTESDPAVEVISTVEEAVSVIESISEGPQGPPGPAGTGAENTITNISPVGGYKVTNIRLDASKKIVLTYEDTPVS